ncbi:MAG: methyltransferase domain-containing protein [Chloracidobacterium sp.]|nr:methyltransferase domain-containing protein [Chloracidobacterium sp.]
MTDIELKENLWGYAKRLRFVCAAIEAGFPGKAPSELRILDVGCGSATQLGLPLARRGYRLTGTDTHEPSIAKARELSDGISNASFICGTIEDLDAEPFEVVILSEVLEHVDEPEKLLKASLLQLRDDGLVIITVPNGYGEFEWDSWVFRTLGFERLVDKLKTQRVAGKISRHEMPSTENAENGHIQFFTKQRLLTMFNSCGLMVVNECASTLVSGPFASYSIGRIPGFIDWNAKIANMLPMTFSSGWFFALRPISADKN